MSEAKSGTNSSTNKDYEEEIADQLSPLHEIEECESPLTRKGSLLQMNREAPDPN